MVFVEAAQKVVGGVRVLSNVVIRVGGLKTSMFTKRVAVYMQ